MRRSSACVRRTDRGACAVLIANGICTAPGDERRELRYQCTAPWQMNLWQCHAGPAPKPFRDSGAPFGFDRPEYDVLNRNNSVLATERGWVHSQHNRKLTEAGELVAHELGWITYERVEDERCAAAITDRPR